MPRARAPPPPHPTPPPHPHPARSVLEIFPDQFIVRLSSRSGYGTPGSARAWRGEEVAACAVFFLVWVGCTGEKLCEATSLLRSTGGEAHRHGGMSAHAFPRLRSACPAAVGLPTVTTPPPAPLPLPSCPPPPSGPHLIPACIDPSSPHLTPSPLCSYQMPSKQDLKEAAEARRKVAAPKVGGWVGGIGGHVWRAGGWAGGWAVGRMGGKRKP